MFELKCSYCDRVFSPLNYYDIPRIVREGTCPQCTFWLDYVKTKNNPTYVRCNGRHYQITSNKVSNSLKATYVIRFLDDDSVVATEQLTYQGVIPEHFRVYLPDNAIFMSNDPIDEMLGGL